jgi:hypothetical protein
MAVFSYPTPQPETDVPAANQRNQLIKYFFASKMAKYGSHQIQIFILT